MLWKGNPFTPVPRSVTSFLWHQLKISMAPALAAQGWRSTFGATLATLAQEKCCLIAALPNLKSSDVFWTSIIQVFDFGHSHISQRKCPKIRLKNNCSLTVSLGAPKTVSCYVCGRRSLGCSSSPNWMCWSGKKHKSVGSTEGLFSAGHTHNSITYARIWFLLKFQSLLKGKP